MMETGKKNISSIDKEKLYECVCLKTEQDSEKYCFPGIDEEAGSYFEVVDIQPRLEVYDIKGRADIEKCLGAFIDEELAEIKLECARAFLKSTVRLEDEEGGEANRQTKSAVPDFIYTF